MQNWDMVMGDLEGDKGEGEDAETQRHGDAENLEF